MNGTPRVRVAATKPARSITTPPPTARMHVSRPHPASMSVSSTVAFVCLVLYRSPAGNATTWTRRPRAVSSARIVSAMPGLTFSSVMIATSWSTRSDSESLSAIVSARFVPITTGYDSSSARRIGTRTVVKATGFAIPGIRGFWMFKAPHRSPTRPERRLRRGCRGMTRSRAGDNGGRAGGRSSAGASPARSR